MSNDIVESLAILKAQQMADAAVIACLLSAVATGSPLGECWKQTVAVSTVEEQLHAVGNSLAQIDDYKARMTFWDGIVRSLNHE